MCYDGEWESVWNYKEKDKINVEIILNYVIN